jgi:23S rRNA-/tRNA-specific pseudouridylate synthase
MSAPEAIGFPAPLLGEKTLRMRVVHASPGLVALLKPPGVAWDDHPWNPGRPHIMGAMREQLAAGKPELVALGIAKPASVHYIEPEVGGVGLVADRESESLDKWRNAFGSEALTFTYRMLAITAGAPAEGGECPLPVAMHRAEARALVSHVTGKKSLTKFKAVEKLGMWTMWEATTTLPRPHQVRLHAAEAGIVIVGETLYSQGGDIRLSQLMRKGRLNKGDDRAINEGLCMRLAEIDCSRVDPAVGVIAGEDEAWTGLLTRLRKAQA